MKEEIFQYVKKKYKTVPDYPFRTASTYPVLRHADTRKWFALIMDVPRKKLGLKGAEYVDIINVLLGDDAHEMYKKLITPNKERRSK